MKPRVLVWMWLTLAACGSDAPDTTADAASQQDANGASCDRTGFAPTSQTAERDDELGVLFYTGSRGEVPNIERLTIDLYFPLGASDAVQDFELTGESLADCHTCVMAKDGCGESLCVSGKTFLAQSGTLSISAIGGIGTNLQGSLRASTFAEVTIGEGLETTLVPGGETWCVDDYDFAALVSAPL